MTNLNKYVSLNRPPNPTRFDQWIQSARQGLEGVLSVMSKDVEAHTKWSIFGMWYDFLQIVAYPLYGGETFPWKDMKIMSWVLDGLDILNPSAAANSISKIFKIVLVFLAALWVALIVVAAVVSAYSFSQGNFRSLLPLQFLRATARLTTTALFVPLASLLISVYKCTTGEYWNETPWECYGVEHSMLMAIVSVLLPCFWIFSLCVSAVFFDRNYRSANITARSHGRVGIMMISIKSMLTLIFTLSSQINPWFLHILLVAFGALWLWLYLKFLPNFSQLTNKTWSAFGAVFFWASICSLLAAILDNPEAGVAGYVFYVGVPTSAFIGYALAYIRFHSFGRVGSPGGPVMSSPYDVELRVRFILRDVLVTTQQRVSTGKVHVRRSSWIPRIMYPGRRRRLYNDAATSSAIDEFIAEDERNAKYSKNRGRSIHSYGDRNPSITIGSSRAARVMRPPIVSSTGYAMDNSNNDPSYLMLTMSQAPAPASPTDERSRYHKRSDDLENERLASIEAAKNNQKRVLQQSRRQRMKLDDLDAELSSPGDLNTISLSNINEKSLSSRRSKEVNSSDDLNFSKDYRSKSVDPNSNRMNINGMNTGHTNLRINLNPVSTPISDGFSNTSNRVNVVRSPRAVGVLSNLIDKFNPYGSPRQGAHSPRSSPRSRRASSRSSRKNEKSHNQKKKRSPRAHSLPPPSLTSSSSVYVEYSKEMEQNMIRDLGNGVAQPSEDGEVHLMTVGGLHYVFPPNIPITNLEDLDDPKQVPNFSFSLRARAPIFEPSHTYYNDVNSLTGAPALGVRTKAVTHQQEELSIRACAELYERAHAVFPNSAVLCLFHAQFLHYFTMDREREGEVIQRGLSLDPSVDIRFLLFQAKRRLDGGEDDDETLNSLKVVKEVGESNGDQKNVDPSQPQKQNKKREVKKLTLLELVQFEKILGESGEASLRARVAERNFWKELRCHIRASSKDNTSSIPLSRMADAHSDDVRIHIGDPSSLALMDGCCNDSIAEFAPSSDEDDEDEGAGRKLLARSQNRTRRTSEVANFAKLHSLASEMSTSIQIAQNAFERLLQMRPNSVEILQSYATFLLEVKRDIKQANLLFDQADEILQEEEAEHLRMEQEEQRRLDTERRIKEALQKEKEREEMMAAALKRSIQLNKVVNMFKSKSEKSTHLYETSNSRSDTVLQNTSNTTSIKRISGASQKLSSTVDLTDTAETSSNLPSVKSQSKGRLFMAFKAVADKEREKTKLLKIATTNAASTAQINSVPQNSIENSSVEVPFPERDLSRNGSSRFSESLGVTPPAGLQIPASVEDSLNGTTSQSASPTGLSVISESTYADSTMGGDLDFQRQLLELQQQQQKHQQMRLPNHLLSASFGYNDGSSVSGSEANHPNSFDVTGPSLKLGTSTGLSASLGNGGLPQTTRQNVKSAQEVDIDAQLVQKAKRGASLAMTSYASAISKIRRASLVASTVAKFHPHQNINESSKLLLGSKDTQNTPFPPAFTSDDRKMRSVSAKSVEPILKSPTSDSGIPSKQSNHALHIQSPVNIKSSRRRSIGTPSELRKPLEKEAANNNNNNRETTTQFISKGAHIVSPTDALRIMDAAHIRGNPLSAVLPQSQVRSGWTMQTSAKLFAPGNAPAVTAAATDSTPTAAPDIPNAALLISIGRSDRQFRRNLVLPSAVNINGEQSTARLETESDIEELDEDKYMQSTQSLQKRREYLQKQRKLFAVPSNQNLLSARSSAVIGQKDVASLKKGNSFYQTAANGRNKFPNSMKQVPDSPIRAISNEDSENIKSTHYLPSVPLPELMAERTPSRKTLQKEKEQKKDSWIYRGSNIDKEVLLDADHMPVRTDGFSIDLLNDVRMRVRAQSSQNLIKPDLSDRNSHTRSSEGIVRVSSRASLPSASEQQRREEGIQHLSELERLIQRAEKLQEIAETEARALEQAYLSQRARREARTRRAVPREAAAAALRLQIRQQETRKEPSILLALRVIKYLFLLFAVVLVGVAILQRVLVDEHASTIDRLEMAADRALEAEEMIGELIYLRSLANSVLDFNATVRCSGYDYSYEDVASAAADIPTVSCVEMRDLNDYMIHRAIRLLNRDPVMQGRLFSPSYEELSSSNGTYPRTFMPPVYRTIEEQERFSTQLKALLKVDQEYRRIAFERAGSSGLFNEDGGLDLFTGSRGRREELIIIPDEDFEKLQPYVIFRSKVKMTMSAIDYQDYLDSLANGGQPPQAAYEPSGLVLPLAAALDFNSSLSQLAAAKRNFESYHQQLYLGASGLWASPREQELYSLPLLPVSDIGANGQTASQRLVSLSNLGIEVVSKVSLLLNSNLTAFAGSSILPASQPPQLQQALAGLVTYSTTNVSIVQNTLLSTLVNESLEESIYALNEALEERYARGRRPTAEQTAVAFDALINAKRGKEYASSVSSLIQHIDLSSSVPLNTDLWFLQFNLPRALRAATGAALLLLQDRSEVFAARIKQADELFVICFAILLVFSIILMVVPLALYVRRESEYIFSIFLSLPEQVLLTMEQTCASQIEALTRIEIGAANNVLASTTLHLAQEPHNLTSPLAGTMNSLARPNSGIGGSIDKAVAGRHIHAHDLALTIALQAQEHELQKEMLNQAALRDQESLVVASAARRAIKAKLAALQAIQDVETAENKFKLRSRQYLRESFRALKSSQGENLNHVPLGQVHAISNGFSVDDDLPITPMLQAPNDPLSFAQKMRNLRIDSNHVSSPQRVPDKPTPVRSHSTSALFASASRKNTYGLPDPAGRDFLSARSPYNAGPHLSTNSSPSKELDFHSRFQENYHQGRDSTSGKLAPVPENDDSSFSGRSDYHLDDKNLVSKGSPDGDIPSSNDNISNADNYNSRGSSATSSPRAGAPQASVYSYSGMSGVSYSETGSPLLRSRSETGIIKSSRPPRPLPLRTPLIPQADAGIPPTYDVLTESSLVNSSRGLDRFGIPLVEVSGRDNISSSSSSNSTPESASTPNSDERILFDINASDSFKQLHPDKNRPHPSMPLLKTSVTGGSMHRRMAQDGKESVTSFKSVPRSESGRELLTELSSDRERAELVRKVSLALMGPRKASSSRLLSTAVIEEGDESGTAVSISNSAHSVTNPPDHTVMTPQGKKIPPSALMAPNSPSTARNVNVSSKKTSLFTFVNRHWKFSLGSLSSAFYSAFMTLWLALQLTWPMVFAVVLVCLSMMVYNTTIKDVSLSSNLIYLLGRAAQRSVSMSLAAYAALSERPAGDCSNAAALVDTLAFFVKEQMFAVNSLHDSILYAVDEAVQEPLPFTGASGAFLTQSNLQRQAGERVTVGFLDRGLPPGEVNLKLYQDAHGWFERRFEVPGHPDSSITRNEYGKYQDVFFGPKMWSGVEFSYGNVDPEPYLGIYRTAEVNLTALLPFPDSSSNSSRVDSRTSVISPVLRDARSLDKLLQLFLADACTPTGMPTACRDVTSPIADILVSGIQGGVLELSEVARNALNRYASDLRAYGVLHAFPSVRQERNGAGMDNNTQLALDFSTVQSQVESIHLKLRKAASIAFQNSSFLANYRVPGAAPSFIDPNELNTDAVIAATTFLEGTSEEVQLEESVTLLESARVLSSTPYECRVPPSMRIDYGELANTIHSHGVYMFTIAYNHARMIVDRASDAAMSSYVTTHGILTALGVIVLLLAFLMFVRSRLNKWDADIKRTRGTLLLFPSDVLAGVAEYMSISNSDDEEEEKDDDNN